MVDMDVMMFHFYYLQRKLDGYKFPVYTTDNCPRNKTEWNQRSSNFNCTMGSAYACFPNDDITELIEFCYPLALIAIPRGKHSQNLFSFLFFSFSFQTLQGEPLKYLIVHFINLLLKKCTRKCVISVILFQK